MKNIYLLTLLVGATLLIGCGGGGGGSSTTSTTNSNTIKELASIHKYSITATPTSGGNCKGATGQMVIEGSEISGTVKTGWGDILTIEGSYNQSNGEVDGGFAKNSNRLADYSGEISDNKGSGTWSDSLGCSGTWTGQGYPTNYIETTSTQQTAPTSNSSSSKTFDPDNLQGYEISYMETGLIKRTIIIDCDGSFVVKSSRHGVTIELTHGDNIVISSDKVLLESSINSLDDVSITLINGNIVFGKSVDNMGNVVTDIKQLKSCN